MGGGDKGLYLNWCLFRCGNHFLGKSGDPSPNPVVAPVLTCLDRPPDRNHTSAFPMNIRIYAAFLFLAPAAFGTSMGDTYQQVLADKGVPKSQIEAGSLQILNYSDGTIKLKDGVVVSVSVVSKPAHPAATPSPAPSQTPADRLAAIQQQLRDAVAKAQNIINQPATATERGAQMRVWQYDYWFHPGATKPDFNTVDVRNTQEASYDNEDYVCLKSQPDKVWVGHELEFNSMTKFFYLDRSLPKKKLTNEEMVEINRLYRIIGRCDNELSKAGIQMKPSS